MRTAKDFIDKGLLTENEATILKVYILFHKWLFIFDSRLGISVLLLGQHSGVFL